MLVKQRCSADVRADGRRLGRKDVIHSAVALPNQPTAAAAAPGGRRRGRAAGADGAAAAPAAAFVCLRGSVNRVLFEVCNPHNVLSRSGVMKTILILQVPDSP